MSQSYPHILAADLGGTRIKLGLVCGECVSAIRVIDAEAKAGIAPRLGAIEHAMRELCEEARITPSSCAGIGMAFPCLVDHRAGRITSTIDKYPDSVRVDLPKWANEAFSLRLLLENDAHAALAGEWRYGAGRGFAGVVMMTLGTGVGTSAVIDGVPLRGQHGQAGNLGGHFTINLDGRKCVCGNIGCVETEASTWMLTHLAEQMPEFKRSALSKEDSLDFRAIFQLADNGDAAAIKLRDRALLVWSTAAVNMVHAFDPDLIILGGGIMKTPEPTRTFIENYVNEHCWLGGHKVMVRSSELDDSAALLGLGYLVAQAQRRS